jgi:hypothetical protein
VETNSADSTLIGVSSLVVAPQLHQAVFRNKATWWIACQVFDHAPQIYAETLSCCATFRTSHASCGEVLIPLFRRVLVTPIERIVIAAAFAGSTVTTNLPDNTVPTVVKAVPLIQDVVLWANAFALYALCAINPILTASPPSIGVRLTPRLSTQEKHVIAHARLSLCSSGSCS